jgi:hypothetical protein
MASKAWSEEVFEQVRQGVYAANACLTEELNLEWDQRVQNRAALLSSHQVNTAQANLNVVLFHIKIPDEASKVSAPDIRTIDHGAVDYETLIRLNIQVAQHTNPRCRVILITDHLFLAGEPETDRLTICRISVNGAEPMFERVWAMAAYTESSLFDAPTVFLDSDAFLLRPIHNLFSNDFDVGITHRDIIGQMPINEGVIFANTINIAAVKAVFRAYFASYLAIEQSSEISGIYQNIRRWRGGQLSINAIGAGGQVYASKQRMGIRGARMVQLPCSIYNLSPDDERHINSQLRKRCAILHLKGPRKSWLRALVGVTVLGQSVLNK